MENRWIFLHFNFESARTYILISYNTILRFVINGLFYGKRRLVLWKTTACFMKNDGSFYEKQLLVLGNAMERTTRKSANGKMGNRIVKRPIIFPLTCTYARTSTGVFTFLLSQVSQDYLKSIV